MNKQYIKYTFLVFVLMAMALSCKVTKPYQTPQLNTADLYRGQNGTDTTNMASMPWENLFADTTLKALIREGLYQNLNLKVAIQKIVEAQAALGQAKGALLPNVSGN